MSLNKHPSKGIQDAIEHALSKGWRIIKSGKSAHAFCRLFCPEESREGCQLSVWSTPRNVDTHAKQIRRQIEKCPHSN